MYMFWLEWDGKQGNSVTVTQTTDGKSIVRPPVERETIRVGVIGAGFGANVHVPALRRVPGVQVAALCGTDQERLHDVAAELEIPATFDDYREMLTSSRVDAVTIATPPHLHHPMASGGDRSRTARPV